MLKRQFCMLKAQGRLPLDLPLRPMEAWLLARKTVFLEREAETGKRWRKVSVAELSWDAKRGLELQEKEILLLVSGQRVQEELTMSDVIVDTAPDGAIQLPKEECWMLNFLHLKDKTCLATELTELYGRSETSSKETVIEEKRPKTKCPASVAGAADIDNTNEEASEESPINNVVDVQAELLALVGVEKEAAGDGKVLSKVVKPKGGLKEGCKDQLTPKFYDMIAELPKVRNKKLGEVCSRGPEVSSGVPEVSNAVGAVSTNTKTTEAAEDTGNVLSKAVNPKGWLKENWEDQLTRDFNDMIAKLPKSCFGSTESLPEVCSRGPEASNAVEEVCTDTKKTEASGNLPKTVNGLSKLVQLSTESRPEVCSSLEVCIRVPEVCSRGPEVCSRDPEVCSRDPEVCSRDPEVCSRGPEVCSRGPEVCSRDPEVCSRDPEVCSRDPEVCSRGPEVCSRGCEVSNAVGAVSTNTKTTEAAEDTGNVLSKAVNPKGWLKENWEDQLTRDFNDMIAKLPKSCFRSTESIPEVCSRGPEASNAVEEVCTDTKKTEATGNLLKTVNGLSKLVQLSTESHPEVCSSPEVCIRVPEVFSGVPEVFSGGPEVCRGSPEVFSEVPEAPNAAEEVSSLTKKKEAAEDLLHTENVLSKVVNPKGWLKEDWEDQLTRDFNDMIAKLPKSYLASTESLPEVSIGVPEVSNAVAKVSSEIKKQKKNGVQRFFRRVWKFFTCTNSLPKEE